MLEKLAPLFKAIQKMIATEFLWFITCLLLALPVAALLRLISMIRVNGITIYARIYAEMQQIKLPQIEGTESVMQALSTKITWFYFYILAFAGIYICRFTASSIKVLLTKTK